MLRNADVAILDEREKVASAVLTVEEDLSLRFGGLLRVDVVGGGLLGCSEGGVMCEDGRLLLDGKVGGWMVFGADVLFMGRIMMAVHR